MVAMPNVRTQNASTLFDSQEITRALSIFAPRGQVVELRVLEGCTDTQGRYKRTYSGYFDNPQAVLQALRSIKSAMGFYITLQPCEPDLLHRAKNKLVESQKGSTTSDREITGYNFLLIDIDSDRKIKGISSTAAEHEAALAHTQVIGKELCRRGWPMPLIADSGNGGHAIYRINLSNEQENIDLVKRVLEGLGSTFNIANLHVDTTVGNPARICKLHGTRACKGDNTSERPHRMSRILEAPDTLEIVSLDLLNAIASPRVLETPRPLQTPYTVSKTHEGFTADDFIARHNLQVGEREDYQGGYKWMLDACPFCGNTDNCAILTQAPSGALGFNCSHNSCESKKWQDFRTIYEPDAYTSNDNWQRRPYNAPTPITVLPVGNNAPAAPKKASQEASGDDPKEEKALTRLMRIAETAKYISTSSGALYAEVRVNDHYEIVSINEHGSGFRRWLVYEYKKLYGIAPNSDAISLVMSGVYSDAEYTGKKEKVYTRIAPHNGNVYLDLANEKWECVKIRADGWDIVTRPPVYFRRPNGMLPLPHPTRGGDLERDIRSLINAKEEKDYKLLIAWLVGTLHPYGPYPALNLNGEKGSAKTRTTETLRTIIDPNEAPTRSAPKDPREAAIMAQNNMIVAFDNLSSLPMWLSDTLCRISTGSGYATRMNYTDDQEVIFNATRPIIINGIEDGLVSQADLLDRAMLVTLRPPDVYKSVEDINTLFDELHPRILGALLDVACVALRDRKTVHLDNPPRMADFAKWITASEPALHWQQGDFMTIFTENQSNASSIVVEASPTAAALMRLVEQIETWEGYTNELWHELDKDKEFHESKAAPKNARSLSGQLNRIASSLRIQRIDIQKLPRDKNGTKIILSRMPFLTSSSVANEGASVAKHPASVANEGASVAKSREISGTYTYAEAALQADSTQTGVASVANVARTTPLSTSLESKKREEREKADKGRDFATSATSATPFIAGQQDELRALYGHYQAYAQGKSSLHWYIDGSPFASGMVPTSEHATRLVQCLKSGNTPLVENTKDYISRVCKR